MNAARLPSWSGSAVAPASPSGGAQKCQSQTPPKRPAKVTQVAQKGSVFAVFPTIKPPPTASHGMSRSQQQQQQQQHPPRPLTPSRPTVKMATASRLSNSISASGTVRSASLGLTQGVSHPQQQQQRRQQQQQQQQQRHQQQQHQQQQQERQRHREGVIRCVSNGSATGDTGVSRRSSGGTGVGVSVKPSTSAGAFAAAASASAAASTAGARAGTRTREGGASSRLANVQGTGHGREGSVTSSDDGTVSGDSAEDHILLFSGGGGIHLNNLPFGVPNRQELASLRGATKANGQSTSRAGELSSTRTLSSTRMVRASPSSSSVISGYNVGRGETGGEKIQGVGAKALRIAAGASIKVGGTMNKHPSNSISIPASSALGLSSSATSFGASLLSSSFSSSTSSSSLSWVNGTSSSKRSKIVVQTAPSSLSPRSSEDDSELSSPSTPTNFNHSNFSQIPPASFTPTTMTTATTSPQFSTSQTQLFNSITASPSGLAANLVAAARKLAEENRRSGEAARTRRKIADLEISNASLLQLNQSLEATIRKQAAEMQELRMRVPTPFELGFDLDQDPNSQWDDDVPFSKTFLQRRIPQDVSDDRHAVADNDDGATTFQRIQEMRAESERQADLAFRRVCISIEQMIFEARQALDQSTRPSGVKVLSSFDMYEKKTAYDGVDIHDDDDDTSLDDDLNVGSHSLLLPGYDSEETEVSEDEEEKRHHGQIDDSDHEDQVANRARVRVHVVDWDKSQGRDVARKKYSAIDILNPGSLAYRPP